MLNLSDKELDRLSREAASAHDPGEPTGAASWQMLERRLDKELGRVTPRPNPLRGFRRLSFYFAPAVLLLVGVSYYFIKHNKSNTHPMAAVPAAPVFKRNDSSVGPPGAVVKMEKPPGSAASTPEKSTTLTQNNSDKSNSTPANNQQAEPSPAPSTTTAARPVPSPAGTAPGNTVPAPSSTTPPTARANMHAANPASSPSPTAGAHTHARTRLPKPAPRLPDEHAGQDLAHGNLTHTRGRSNGHGQPGRNGGSTAPASDKVTKSSRPDKNQSGDKGIATGRNGQPTQPTPNASTQPPHITDPASSVVRKPNSLTGAPSIDDSALRHTSAKGAGNNLLTVNIDKKNNQSLHINRSLQLGFSIAPDFASVNSLAGDKPGSTLGITADYQFANRWYIGTGLLYTKRNYTARAEDYHVPQNYYGMNNMHDVNFVKGSFSMLEIPLNLRYDFSLAGNTSFFASAGLSSYLLSKENCNYYYSFFGREVYRKFHYQGDQSQLFSVINLSLGAETGISNSLSLLIAPYMKIPAAKVGFGQVQMSSIGINFALKFAPVLKRKRH